MNIVCVGGGPAGLYLGILMKLRDPAHRVRVIERNRADDTFGFGVVFSDATLDNLRQADAKSYQAITEHFWHWDNVDTHFRGQRLSSSGHGFAGLSRQQLLLLLQARALELGVELSFEKEATDIEGLRRDCDLLVGSDGLSSAVRQHGRAHFNPSVDVRPNRFVWLGTTFPYEAFTFYFKENSHGLFRVHAYRYQPQGSTFIVECTEETFLRTGLSENDEAATVAYCAELFAEQLQGHKLLKNRSIWRRFPIVHNDVWHYDNVVLVGDAVHTVHFSVGSGTKVAMEDVICLARMLSEHQHVPTALFHYETERRPQVESLQRAALASLQWFENTERYMQLDPIQFNFSMLTRSLRVTHGNLALRDSDMVAQVDAWVREQSRAQVGADAVVATGAPPMFTPFRLRDMVLENRVGVSPMCQYSASDGRIGTWHLVHLGSRAVGGAGLIICEMTAVSRQARITPGCAGMYLPEHVTAWKEVVDFVHRNSAAKLALQLGHAGRKGSTRRMWEGIDEPLEKDNWPLLSASPRPYFERSQTPSAMTRAHMDATRDDYVRAARMAEQAGFDMLELHCAHGYLLASFLSPITNRRDDDYGGDIDHRLRYPLEVFAALREVWPAHKPMSVRISATDWVEGGNDGDEAVAIAAAFKAHGCDIIDVSSGQTDPCSRPVYGRLYQTPYADRIRLEVGIPTMTVGNISSYTDVNSVIAAGRADICLLARAHLFDPYWTRHAAQALDFPLPWPDQYAPMNGYQPRFE